MKLGIIGAGKIVHDFLTVANSISDLQLVAISAPPQNLPELKKLQAKYGFKKVYTDNQELLLDSNVDTVYVAVPNSLHYEVCKESLKYGKNVICEKPMVYTVTQAKELKGIADTKHVMLFEAITNLYLENFKEIKSRLKLLGPIHIVNLNYTQLSTRYPKFLKGHLLPVFDPKKGGGALMDLGIYVIHLAVALFGMPDEVKYFGNYAQGTDTSGVIVLKYSDKICNLIVAKDSYAEPFSFIEGEKGSIRINGLINQLPSFSLELKGKDVQDFNFNKHKHRMVSEFETFIKCLNMCDFEAENQAFTQSIQALRVLQEAKASQR